MTNIMITDNETNIIYFSEILKSDQRFSETCDKITEILDSCNIKYLFLPCTKDIWARDYMPIQVTEEKFIEYRYDPDYLQAVKHRNLKTYSDIVCDAINIKTVKTDIILDGGNVVKSKNSVILTDKVIDENWINYKENALAGELRRLFEVDKIIFIPWDKSEDFGHADGMLRFINDQNVVINGYFDDPEYDESFKNELYAALNENGIQYHKLIYTVKNPDTDRNWAYINFFQTKDILLLPKLGIEEDEQALEQFKALFPEYAGRNRIIQVNVSALVAEGGALNCVSWTIKR